MSKSPPEAVDTIVILDRSGSMDAIRSDAIGGFNTFVRQQRASDASGRMSLVLFNQEIEEVYRNRPLEDVPVLDNATFVPRGATALLDAIGRTVAADFKIWSRLPEESRRGMVVAILTDGHENSSSAYSWDQVSSLIDETSAAGWEYLFLAADQDAMATASRLSINIDDAMNWRSDSLGTQQAFLSMDRAVSLRKERSRDRRSGRK